MFSIYEALHFVLPMIPSKLMMSKGAFCISSLRFMHSRFVCDLAQTFGPEHSVIILHLLLCILCRGFIRLEDSDSHFVIEFTSGGARFQASEYVLPCWNFLSTMLFGWLLIPEGCKFIAMDALLIGDKDSEDKYQSFFMFCSDTLEYLTFLV